MKVIFYGGKQAGVVSLFLLNNYFKNIEVIPEDALVKKAAEILNLKQTILEEAGSFDLLVCCHGRKIIPKNMLDKGICINLHPCLYKYKGANPIKSLLSDKETKASVGCHHMSEKVDEGEVIYEKFVDVSECKNETEVYNKLYIYYAEVLSISLAKLGLIKNKLK